MALLSLPVENGMTAVVDFIRTNLLVKLEFSIKATRITRKLEYSF